MGLAKVDTKYVVFADNDIVVQPGWLKTLVDCAETTDAVVVDPLPLLMICQYEPIHEEIALVESLVSWLMPRAEDEWGKKCINRVRQRACDRNLQHSDTELCEFHCMLVRTSIFEELSY